MNCRVTRLHHRAAITVAERAREIGEDRQECTSEACRSRSSAQANNKFVIYHADLHAPMTANSTLASPLWTCWILIHSHMKNRALQSTSNVLHFIQKHITPWEHCQWVLATVSWCKMKTVSKRLTSANNSRNLSQTMILCFTACFLIQHSQVKVRDIQYNPVTALCCHIVNYFTGSNWMGGKSGHLKNWNRRFAWEPCNFQ